MTSNQSRTMRGVLSLGAAVGVSLLGSGQYDIWVGTYQEGRTHSAQLEVSEVWRSSSSRATSAPSPSPPFLF